ncbi:hypothetical protein NQ314_002528 [Rhamnusium bicolor]|uniref:Uncharacterized protein n=1 Tax=Rhamnusium bicolor TaxID=1586634 RepID=A0AAV8ZP17_9CUCU|nr:hypothetical protein NQ314_002528 [Rhamnusium bicolor]
MNYKLFHSLKYHNTILENPPGSDSVEGPYPTIVQSVNGKKSSHSPSIIILQVFRKHHNFS